MGERYDAIIIGAGIIGASIALELARKGWRTLNIDRLPAAGYGSTSGSCAIIRTHYSTLDGTAMAFESYFSWKNWQAYLGAHDERGLAVFHETGCLVYQTEGNDHLRGICRHATELSVPFEAWPSKRIIEHLPFVDLRRFGPPGPVDDVTFAEPSGGMIDGGIFFANAGYINDPQLATHNIQRAAEASGADFRFAEEVAGIVTQGGRVAGVELISGASVAAPVVINVAGPHSARINAMAGVLGGMTIHTRALKQEVAHVLMPEGIDYDRTGFVISDSDIGCYSRPEGGNHILIGSEDPPCDAREWVDADDWDRSFTEQWRTQVLRQAQRMPDLPIPNSARGVVELYDVSDDWIPIYDRSDLPGYYMAIGSSGNQFKNAPVAGAMMAALIEACEGGRDHDADPLRFHLPHIDRTIDVGFYSRRRTINPDSSFSVLG